MLRFHACHTLRGNSAPVGAAQLDKHLPRPRNFSVAVKEWNDEIGLMRRAVPGAADRRYGIQVTRLAAWA